MSAQLADFLKDNRKVNQIDITPTAFHAANNASDCVDIDDAESDEEEDDFKAEFTRLISSKSLECIIQSNHLASYSVLRFESAEINMPKVLREKENVDSWCNYMDDMTVLKPKAITTIKRRNPDGNGKGSRSRSLRNSIIGSVSKLSQSTDQFQVIRGPDYESSRAKKHSSLRRTKPMNESVVNSDSVVFCANVDNTEDTSSENSETSGENASSPVSNNFASENDILEMIMNYKP